MQEVRVRFTRHIRQAFPVLAHVVCAPLIAIVLVRFHYDGQYADTAWVLVAGYLAAIVIPQAALHIRYTLVSRPLTVRVLENGSTLLLDWPQGRRRVSKSDIFKIEVIAPLALAGRAPMFYPWLNYAYAVFYLGSGEQFVITTLHSDEILNPLGFQAARLTHDSYCWPPASRMSADRR